MAADRRPPEDHAGLHGVQAPQLHHQEEPAQRPRPAGAEEVLPELPRTPAAPRDALGRPPSRRSTHGLRVGAAQVAPDPTAASAVRGGPRRRSASSPTRSATTNPAYRDRRRRPGARPPGRDRAAHLRHRASACGRAARSSSTRARPRLRAGRPRRAAVHATTGRSAPATADRTLTIDGIRARGRQRAAHRPRRHHDRRRRAGLHAHQHDRRPAAPRRRR